MTLKLPALDPESAEVRKGTDYPPPFDEAVGGARGGRSAMRSG